MAEVLSQVLNLGIYLVASIISVMTSHLSEGGLLLLPVRPLPAWSPVQLLARGVLPVLAGQQSLPHPGAQPPHLLPQGTRQILVILQAVKKEG